MDRIKKNIMVYKMYSLFSELLIIGPIITLYLFEKGLNFTQITILQSVFALAIVLFEVPTGAIADKISRRLSLSIGTLMVIFALLIYIVGKSLYIFIFAEILFSLGRSFKSGADTALIYESLSVVGREKEYPQIEGIAKQYLLYGQAVGSIIASFAYGVNIHLPMIISAVNLFIAFIITFSFCEEGISSDKHESYYNHIKSSYKYIVNHDKVKSIIMYSTLISVFLRVAFWYYQPYMYQVKIPVTYFGIIFFMFNVVAAYSAKNSDRFIKLTKSRTLLSMAVLMMVSLLLLGSIKVWLGIFSILLQQVIRGVTIPIIRKYLNKHIINSQRATILSFNSLVTNLFVVIVLPVAGILVDKTNIYSAHLILGAMMLISTFMINEYTKQRLVSNRN